MAADTVERIKEKLTIVDVITPYVKLARAGKYVKGLCPIHKEKTPSFHVNPERGTFHCFGCGAGGDMFTFIETMEGVDFKGALKILAERAGVPLTYEKGGAKEKTDRLREAMARAEVFYSAALTENSPGRAYARSRGLNPETIASWGLGVAPDAWRELLEALTKQGYTVEELAAAGLVKEAEGKPGTFYDRFRNRLMFPIRDTAGRVVAFTGRALDPNEGAKYLNSPETDLFRKSALLFAMDRAKEAIRTRNFALLTEGQMDVLHAHQAGFTNAVALSGTALTPEHLALLKRYSENLMLALDGDRAGLAATQKHALAALRSGLRVKAVRLPKGKDPADLISENAAEFGKRVAEAKSVVEFFLGILAEGEKDQHRLVILVERVVLPLVAAVQSPIEREHFVGIVARAISSTPEAVRDTLARVARGDVPRALAPESLGTSAAPPVTDAVRLAAIVMTYPETPLANRVKSEYARIVGSPLSPEDSPEHVLFETGILYGEAPEEHAADDVLTRFEKSVLRKAYDAALAQLRQAELAGDKGEIGKAAAACDAIAKSLAAL